MKKKSNGYILLMTRHIYDKDHMSELRIKNISEKQQLQKKRSKNSEAPTGFEPMTSTIPVRCSTN